MKCPVDGETLVMTERSGVEIDYCPKCRGVWLDRGELDKILERGATPAAAAPQAPVYREERRDVRHEKDRYDDRYHGKRKREGFLSDLFDF